MEMSAKLKSDKKSKLNSNSIYAVLIVILSLVNPTIAFPVALFAMWNDKTHWKTYVFVFGLFFAAVSYSYTPWGDSDLVRYWAKVRQMSMMSFSQAISGSYVFGNSGTILYTFNLLCWIVGKAGDLNLLSALSTFVVYYIAFYVTCSIGEDYEIKWSKVFFYLIFIMCLLDWYSIANNVRNVVAFSIVGLAVFRDIYQKKLNAFTIFLYIAGIFLHPTALLLVAVRLLIKIIKKAKIILFLSVFMIGLLVNTVYNYFSSFLSNTLFGWFIRKAYDYFNDTSSEYGLAVQVSRYARVTRIVCISFAVIFCVYFIIKTYKSGSSSGCAAIKKISYFQYFVFVVGLCVISCISMLTPGYWRFYSALVIFGSALYFPFLNNDLNKKLSLYTTIYSCTLCISCVALWVYPIHNYLFTDIASKLISNCPIYIFINDLIYFFSH